MCVAKNHQLDRDYFSLFVEYLQFSLLAFAFKSQSGRLQIEESPQASSSFCRLLFALLHLPRYL